MDKRIGPSRIRKGVRADLALRFLLVSLKPRVSRSSTAAWHEMQSRPIPELIAITAAVRSTSSFSENGRAPCRTPHPARDGR
jgi:hypothetical protein